MPAELIAVSDQDEAIFELWQGGAGLRQIARQMGISRMAVEQALDRVLPVLSQVTQARAYKRHLFFMEDLETEFYAIAKRDKSIDAAHLCARLNERVCAMNGWSSMSIKMDPLAAQAAAQPSSYEKITAAIMRVSEQMPPAQRAALQRIKELGPDRALELLNGGSNSEQVATGTAPERDTDAT